MTTKAYEHTWATYQSAWRDIADDERRQLLERAVSEDCTYSDPVGSTSGREELIAYIEQFHVTYPGSTFDNHKLLDHHGEAIATWTRLQADGSSAGDGNSYAHFGEDGRLVRIVGFFDA